MSEQPTSIQVTPPRMRENIRAVIKMMIGDRDRIHEQVKRLDRDDLAEDMREQEGYILDALRYCSEQELPPTAENIISALEFPKRIQVESPREFVEALLKEHEGDTQGIRALSNFIHIWVQEQSLGAFEAQIARLRQDPYMDYPDKWQKTYDKLMYINPGEGFVYDEMSEVDFRKVAMEESERAAQLHAQGLATGPQFPFEGMKALFTSLEWGEVTMITGKKGMGKTSIAQTLGENISWAQRLDTDTIHIALETPIEVLSRRQFCRYNIVTYNDVKDGVVARSKPGWAEKWDKWIEGGRRKANGSGYVRYSYSPGASVNDIVALMTRSSETSLALGRRIVFIIDHLHSINWEATHGKIGEYAARRAIFEILAAHANKLNARNKNHLFVFAQEGAEKGQTFGGKFQSRRAQYVFSLSRGTFGEPDSEGELPGASENCYVHTYDKLLSADHKKSGKFEQDTKDKNIWYVLDATGKRRFYYKVGDKYNHKTTITAMWGNDNGLGKVELIFEAPISRLQQDADQLRQLMKDGLLDPVQVK